MTGLEQVCEGRFGGNPVHAMIGSTCTSPHASASGHVVAPGTTDPAVKAVYKQLGQIAKYEKRLRDEIETLKQANRQLTKRCDTLGELSTYALTAVRGRVDSQQNETKRIEQKAENLAERHSQLEQWQQRDLKNLHRQELLLHAISKTQSDFRKDVQRMMDRCMKDIKHIMAIKPSREDIANVVETFHRELNRQRIRAEMDVSQAIERTRQTDHTALPDTSATQSTESFEAEPFDSRAFEKELARAFSPQSFCHETH